MMSQLLQIYYLAEGRVMILVGYPKSIYPCEEYSCRIWIHICLCCLRFHWLNTSVACIDLVHSWLLYWYWCNPSWNTTLLYSNPLFILTMDFFTIIIASLKGIFICIIKIKNIILKIWLRHIHVHDLTLLFTSAVTYFYSFYTFTMI